MSLKLSLYLLVICCSLVKLERFQTHAQIRNGQRHHLCYSNNPHGVSSEQTLKNVTILIKQQMNIKKLMTIEPQK